MQNGRGRVRWLRRGVGRVFLGVVLAGLLASCATLTTEYKKPTLTLERIHWLSGTWSAQHLEVELKVQNDNAVALPLVHVDFALTLDGAAIGTGSVDKPITVPAHGNSVVPVEMTVDLSTALLKIVPKMKDGSPPLHYAISGKLQAKVFGVRDYPIDLKGDWSPGR